MKCPICGEKYKVTLSPVLNKEWYDCVKCNKTKEECEASKELHKKPDNDSSSRIEDLEKYWRNYSGDYDIFF